MECKKRHGGSILSEYEYLDEWYSKVQSGLENANWSNSNPAWQGILMSGDTNIYGGTGASYAHDLFSYFFGISDGATEGKLSDMYARANAEYRGALPPRWVEPMPPLERELATV